MMIKSKSSIRGIILLYFPFAFIFYIFKNRLCCFAQPVLSQIAVSFKKHTENRSFFTKSIVCIGIYFCHMLLVTVSKMCYTGVQTKSSAERIRIMAKRVDLLHIGIELSNSSPQNLYVSELTVHLGFRRQIGRASCRERV